MLQLSHVHSNVETSVEARLSRLLSSLQLSHVHSNVETVVHALSPCFRNTASIEPRSFKRGNESSPSSIYLSPQASIEPRSFKRGNESSPSSIYLIPQASIEPRSFKRGNPGELHITALPLPMLQLSHVHSNVETSGGGGPGGQHAAASIEPRSFKRGNCARSQPRMAMTVGFRCATFIQGCKPSRVARRARTSLD